VHLPPCHPDLNPTELVCGDIKNRVAQECMSMNLKEIQTFAKKKSTCLIHRRKIAKLLLPHEKDRRGILAMK
jgi:hypothetical protein